MFLRGRRLGTGNRGSPWQVESERNAQEALRMLSVIASQRGCWLTTASFGVIAWRSGVAGYMALSTRRSAMLIPNPALEP